MQYCSKNMIMSLARSSEPNPAFAAASLQDWDGLSIHIHHPNSMLRQYYQSSEMHLLLSPSDMVFGMLIINIHSCSLCLMILKCFVCVQS